MFLYCTTNMCDVLLCCASSMPTGVRPYREVSSPEAAQAKAEELLADHNALSKRPMQLAMFLYAVEHVVRIARCVTK